MLLLLALPMATAATWPAGSTVEDAAALQLSEEGLAAAGALLPTMVPATAMPVPPVEYAGGNPDWCLNYELTLDDAWVSFAVDSATIIPGAGQLTLRFDAHAWLNDETDPFTLTYELFCLGEDCPGYVEPFPVTIDAPVSLDVRADGYIDATIGEVSYTHGLESSHFALSCNIDTIDEVLDYFGYSLFEFIVSIAETQISSVIEDQKDDIEATLEEVLNQARVDTTVDMAGIPLEVELDPQDIWISPEGLELVYEGRLSAPEDGCVAEWDPGESVGGDSSVPPVSEAPEGTHAALLVSDDMANQGLYAIWRGGLLCQELPGEGDVELPIALDTTLLGLLAGDAFDEVIPETVPLIIRTAPRKPPVVDYDTEHDLTVEITELGLDLYAPVDYRMAHPLGLDVAVDAGVDLAFDGTTGKMDVLVTLGQDDITAVASSNELVPEATADIEANFGSTVAGLMDAMLGSLLSDLSFDLPSLEGFGLTSMEMEAVPGAEDWLRGRATVGDVPYGSDSEGCSGEGGEGGCSSSGVNLAWWLALSGLLVARRRK